MKVKLIITFITLLLISLNLNSQTNDSINTYSFDKLSDKYYEYKSTDSLKAKNLANFYFNKAVKENDTVNAIYGKYYLREVYNKDSIFINYIDSLVNLTKLNPNKIFPAFAYYEKGNLFFDKEIFSQALNNYILSLKHSKSNKNDSLYYIVKQRIGVLKGVSKNYNETKLLYLECLNYYNINKTKIDPNNYFSLFYNLSNIYSKLDKIDSSKIYIDKALKFSSKIKDSILIGYSQHKLSEIEYSFENYEEAIKISKSATPQIIRDENYRILLNNYNLIAKANSKLNNKNEALKYFFLIDSVFNKTKIIHITLKDSYKYLANHYKEKKDLKNQLKYIEKYLKIDSVLNKRDNNLTKTFSKKYDTPKFIAEKEIIISKLKKNISSHKNTKAYLISFLSFILLLFLFQYYKTKKQRNKFEELVSKLKSKKTKISLVEINSKKTQTNIPEDVVNEVLEKLILFEKNPKNFTNNKITLALLATQFGTNTNYLSKIINQQKGSNFTTYLNKLRVNYTLILLEENEIIRKYNIAAIAKEVGFNSSESFSKAFFRETQLNPSYYIKELTKIEKK